MALALSLLIGSAIILASGVNPLDAYSSLADGAVGSPAALGRTIENATPLILTGLAVAFAFRGGLFNIGADGQFYAGAVTAAWGGVALAWPAHLGVVATLALAAGAGGSVAAIAGFLKARFGAHEVVTTIMLNFIVIDLANWLLLNPLSDNSGVPGSRLIAPDNRISQLSTALAPAHWGFAVAIGAALVAYVVLWRTSLGMELRVAGLAPAAARYSGSSRMLNAVVTMAISGAFAGLAGAIEVFGTYGHMTVPFVSNLGFLGIGVALLGRNHPFGCVIGGLVLGGLAAGGQQMQFDVGLSAHLVDVLVGVILLLVTAEMLRRRRTRMLPAAATEGL
jgi:simple sugar transport system permease protein